MKFAVELVLIIAINVWGMYAVWWVNRHIDLSGLPSRISRIWLRSFIGKVGYLQLGFPCQGVMFLYEVSTPWYDTYQRLESAADDYDGRAAAV